ncbi:MAG: TonB-dependent receptor, partial [Pseudomonadales bacterium]|nr:TonB-dependent receptor [Pseudomonadales bacterium]
EGAGGRIVDIGDGDTIEIDNQPPLSVGGQYIDTSVTCENTGNGETVWYDPFNKQNAADNDAFKTDAKRRGEAEMLSWDATISTMDLFELPAGSVAAAFGVEYRNEKINDVPAGVTVANEKTNDPVWAYAGTSADYERTSTAAFFEMVAPLASGLEATLAGRLDHYDDFGTDFNPMVRLRYQPLDQLTFRANWSTSFRAPSLAQAGQGTRLTSHTFSCENLPSDLDNPVTGDAANFCDGTDVDVADIDGVTEGLNTEELGSDDLEAETANNYGFGFVLTPNDDITLSVDWWRIEYDNLVSAFNTDVEQSWIEEQIRDGNYVLGSNLSDLSSGNAGVLIDENTGEILDTHFQLFNTGFQNVEGIDLAYTQYFDLNNYGTLKWMVDASYLVEYEEKVCKSCEVDQLAGEYSYPSLKASTGLRWRKNNWSTSVFANYTHSYEEDGTDDRVGGPTTDELAEIGIDVADIRDVPSWTVWDLNVSYDFDSGSYLSFNVDNVFDKDAPRTYSNYEGVDFYNHNVMGRAYSVRYTHAF